MSTKPGDYTDKYLHQATGRRAIIIGGGMAGLLAARVLSDYFTEVILLERDRYPDGPELRSGVPQARHVHLLLLRGKQILERFFPGLKGELIDKGAEIVKMGEELRVMTYYGWRVKHPGGLTLLTFTQPLLECCVRRRLTRISAVKMVEGCRVTGLIPGEGDSVRGVRGRFPDDLQKDQALSGELIVDASGRFSRTPEWLSDLGYECPEETIVDPFLGYASRLYEMPNGSGNSRLPPGCKAVLLFGKPPDHTRGGVLLPVENNRWHVTLVGVGKDYPPYDDDGFLEFARTLRSDIIYSAIKKARPLTPVNGYRATNNRRRHYERLPQWPDGFVVMGDALCAFNPVYAQGMSVAALQAVILDQCLRNHNSRDRNRIAATFQQEVAKVIDTPWLMATTDDLRWPETEGGDSGLITGLMHNYLDAITALATEDPEIHQRFSKVIHLIEPTYKLLHPRIAFPALARVLNPYSD